MMKYGRPVHWNSLNIGKDGEILERYLPLTTSPQHSMRLSILIIPRPCRISGDPPSGVSWKPSHEINT